MKVCICGHNIPLGNMSMLLPETKQHNIGDADAALGHRAQSGLNNGQWSLVPAVRLNLQLADGTPSHLSMSWGPLTFGI